MPTTKAIIALALTLALTLTLAGCVTTQSQPDPATEPKLTTIGVGSLGVVGAPGVRTFAIMPTGRIVRSLPGADPARTVAAIDRAIASTFADRGYTLVQQSLGADRVIAYAAGATGTLDDASLNRVFGISPGLDNNRDELKGALVVAILDPMGRVLWRGSVGAELDAEAPQQQRLDRISSAVATLLRDLPYQSSR